VCANRHGVEEREGTRVRVSVIINQAINQSINHKIINQRKRHGVDVSINQSSIINQSVNQSINHQSSISVKGMVLKSVRARVCASA